MEEIISREYRWEGNKDKSLKIETEKEWLEILEERIKSMFYKKVEKWECFKKEICYNNVFSYGDVKS